MKFNVNKICSHIPSFISDTNNLQFLFLSPALSLTGVSFTYLDRIFILLSVSIYLMEFPMSPSVLFIFYTQSLKN